MDNVNSLLKEVNDIYQKYVKDAMRTGEKFNIFQKIGLLEEDHSTIIAELLNQDSHDMGNEFIKLFLYGIKRNIRTKFEELNIQDVEELNIQEFEKARVETEITTKDIEINETEKLNGRVDILITGNNEAKIVIENKTNTKDGKNQLKKYRVAYPSAWLVYLTPNREEPRNYNYYGDPKLILMSYKDIINWLEQCKEENENLQGIIAQYIYLLKSITGQSWRENMSDDIVKALTQSSAYVKSAFEIANAINAKKIDYEIIKRFISAMKEFAYEEGLKLSEEPKPEDCHKQFWHISLCDESWRKECVRIRFQFDGEHLMGLACGFCIVKEDGKEATEEEAKDINKKGNRLIDNIKNNNKILGIGKNDEKWWLSYSTMPKQSREELLADLAIIENSTIMKDCKDKIKRLLPLVEDYKPS
jgi:hypothetical protein